MTLLHQANFLMPDNILRELRRTVPKGQQSRVVVQALERELKRIRFTKSLERHFGGDYTTVFNSLNWINLW